MPGTSQRFAGDIERAARGYDKSAGSSSQQSAQTSRKFAAPDDLVHKRTDSQPAACQDCGTPPDCAATICCRSSDL